MRRWPLSFPAVAGAIVGGLAAQQPAPDGVISGAVFSADYAVIQFRTVILQDLSKVNIAWRAPLDPRGQYRIAVPPGIYQIQLEASRDLLPYRRANVNIRAGEEPIVNLYPVQRTGIAMTIHGDIALPDPQVYYEQFPVGGDVNLVIQYSRRTRSGDAIAYQGSDQTLTFDTVTIAGDAIKLDPTTLVATIENAVRIDLGGRITRSPITKPPKVKLRIQERMIQVAPGTAVEERRF